jgi:hypothetical protein
MLLATLCFVLTLATYQPKVALVALLLLIWCVQGTRLVGEGQENSSDRRHLPHIIVRYILPSVFTFATAVWLYYLSVKLTVIYLMDKNQINDLEGILTQLVLAYPETFRNFTERVDYLPQLLKYLPALGILLGTAALAWQAYRVQKGLVLVALTLVALFPAALQLSYIINEYTWSTAGRILTPHAYFLLFFLTSAWSVSTFRSFATLLMAVFVYYFCIVGIQETNAAAMKTIFDLGKINRCCYPLGKRRSGSLSAATAGGCRGGTGFHQRTNRTSKEISPQPVQRPVYNGNLCGVPAGGNTEFFPRTGRSHLAHSKSVGCRACQPAGKTSLACA